MLREQHLQAVVPAIERQCEQARVAQRLPGLCVGVVRDQELAWSCGFGVADHKTGRPPDARTLFRVASITKTLTTAAVMQQRDLGRWSLDDPLARYVPEVASVAPRAGPVSGLTLRRLLAHQAGLSTEGPFPYWDTLDFPDRERLLGALRDVAVCLPAEQQFKYSNLAFALLGEAVARVADCPFDRYLEENILKPLGMSSSGLRTGASDPRMARGYCADPFSDELAPAPLVDLRGLAPCGQLVSSAEDLAKWVSLQFRTAAAQRGGSQILRGSTIAECHKPLHLERDWSVGYCLGWRANRFGERVYLGHGGALFGYSSYVLFSPVHCFGVICLANVWPHPGLLGIAAEIANLLSAQAEGDERANENAWAYGPGSPERIAGLYVAASSIFVAVARRNGRYRLEKPPGSEYLLHAPAELEPTDDPAAWMVRGGRAAGELATFQFAGNGAASQFALGGFVYRRVTPA